MANNLAALAIGASKEVRRLTRQGLRQASRIDGGYWSLRELSTLLMLFELYEPERDIAQ
jgi:hypothetical protein